MCISKLIPTSTGIFSNVASSDHSLLRSSSEVRLVSRFSNCSCTESIMSHILSSFTYAINMHVNVLNIRQNKKNTVGK